MVYKGRVQNGAIVLDGAPRLPEGAAVEVLLEPGSGLTNSGEPGNQTDAAAKHDPLWLEKLLRPYAGTVHDWPADMALNHDHYLHGAPKKPPPPPMTDRDD